jgi:hypothetical protein
MTEYMGVFTYDDWRMMETKCVEEERHAETRMPRKWQEEKRGR